MTATAPSTVRPVGLWRSVGLWGWLLRVLAVGYPAALVAIILVLRFVGERWWLSSALLYLPRLGFVLPLPFIVLLLLLGRRRWLLLTQLVALVLLLFPLMGLRLPGAPSRHEGAFHLRVASYNIATGPHGPQPILEDLRGTDADVILLQETDQSLYQALIAGLAGYQVHTSGQFLIASRFPVDETIQPPSIPHRGKARSARFVSYRLTTPAGPLQIFNVHPISPREALAELRGEGLKSELESGRLLRGTASDKVMDNTELRLQQVEMIAADAHRSPAPVIIAGDTNLPTLSWALARWLGDYRDGFAEAGSGFGWTFPAPRHPWMRIDRVLADPRLRVVGFHVVESPTSDHFPVVADLELPSPPPGR
jgi:endonuclease/exonuclease/phosphatase (EEP) superfamily protein YafD